mgnify:FL=1
MKLGKPTDERHILVSKGDATYQFGVDYMRDVWYSSSYLLDRKQSMNGCAKKRFENYKMQPVEFAFMPGFKGKLSQYGITPDRRTPSGVRAAIIREKGTNGEREMAYSLYLAGFDVKDVTMTDLISGRETLEDVNMIVTAVDSPTPTYSVRPKDGQEVSCSTLKPKRHLTSSTHVKIRFHWVSATVAS